MRGLRIVLLGTLDDCRPDEGKSGIEYEEQQRLF